MSVKIVTFEAENVKRVKCVQMAPSENGLTIIGGKNKNGKRKPAERPRKRSWKPS